jgi:UBX domain-containing protein 1
MGDVEQFILITSADKPTADFYLASANGNLEEAIEQFYANGGESVPSFPKPSADPSPPAPSRHPPPAAANKSKSKNNASNVRSLGDLGDDAQSDDEEGYNDYYAGGEKSGQVVRGAPKDKVQDLFESARRAGAQQGRPEDLHPLPPSGPSGSRTFFTGTSRTLAGGGDASPLQHAPSTSSGAAAPPSAAGPRRIVIAFYANGIFTVDDGEPREMNDPANTAFMQSIMKGECPAELTDPNSDPTIPINVNLVRKDIDYEPPAQPKYKAFGGSGRKLGGAEDGDVEDSEGKSAAAAIAKPPPSTTTTGSWEGADPLKPKTTIQLRLADGSRLVAEFNLSQTVADIRRFINTARPGGGSGGGGYRLVTAFPAGQLEDDGATIEEAGLANSVVIQKQ